MWVSICVMSLRLFPIYINDITQASFFHTILFTDDINIPMSNPYFLPTTVNLELCITDHWLKANKPTLKKQD